MFITPSMVTSNSRVLEFAVVLVLLVALLFGFSLWFYTELETVTGTNLEAIKSAKVECEENIPRNQECSFVYTFIPPEEKLVENE